nr:MFS transporter [Micromonospora okii]
MSSAAPARRTPGPYRALFADRTFRRLMPVFALSDLGDGMTVVAVAWLAFTLGPDGGQGTLAGIAVASYVLPGALGALVLGRWLRRFPAQRLLVTDSALRAVLLGAVPLAHLAGWLTPAVYVGLLAASSLLHAWGKAGKHAIFAPLLSDDQRLAANSMLSTSLWSAIIVGPALAGLLVGVVSPAWIIGLDAATFAVLAVRTGRTALPQAPATPATGGAQRGLGILRRQPELLGLLLVTWVFNLAFGPVEVALPMFVSDLGAGAGLLGAYWAAFGVGAVIGASALGAARRLPLWPAMLGIIAGHGLGLLPFALTETAFPSLIGFAFAGLVYGPYSALSLTLIQERAPADSLTTVLAARSAVLLTASPLGAALGGFLLDRAGAPAVLVGCGALMILVVPVSVVVLRRYGRSPRRLAVDPPADPQRQHVRADREVAVEQGRPAVAVPDLGRGDQRVPDGDAEPGGGLLVGEHGDELDLGPPHRHTGRAGQELEHVQVDADQAGGVEVPVLDAQRQVVADPGGRDLVDGEEAVDPPHLRARLHAEHPRAVSRARGPADRRVLEGRAVARGGDPVPQRRDIADGHRHPPDAVVHEGADAPGAGHHPLGGELAQHLTHGGPADLQPVGQLTLVGQLVAGAELAADELP